MDRDVHQLSFAEIGNYPSDSLILGNQVDMPVPKFSCVVIACGNAFTGSYREKDFYFASGERMFVAFPARGCPYG